MGNRLRRTVEDKRFENCYDFEMFRVFRRRLDRSGGGRDDCGELRAGLPDYRCAQCGQPLRPGGGGDGDYRTIGLPLDLGMRALQGMRALGWGTSEG